MGEILDKKKTDLEMTQFATLSAIKGKQFGRDIYSSIIKFNDLHEFLEVFPEVQRDIIPKKVKSMMKYIQSGLEEDAQIMRFFSAVTVTCKTTIFYDETHHRCAIDTHNAKLSINDGQHRFEAVRRLIPKLEEDFLKSKDKERTGKIRMMIEQLKEMVIPIVIFDGLTTSEEKQLFHDLNNLAQRPSRNANIRLNQTDYFSQIARELAVENRYLTHYGVEMDKMSISGNQNPNTILLSTIYAASKEFLGLESRHKDELLNDGNYEQIKKLVSDTFDKLFFVLPHDIDVRHKYIIEKSYAIKSMARFISHSRNHLDLQLEDEEIFEIIKNVDWSYNISEWSKYGGIEGTDGNIIFGGGSGAGHRAVYMRLLDEALLVADKKGKKKKEKATV